MKKVHITPRKKRGRKKTPRKKGTKKIKESEPLTSKYTFKSNNSSILKELLLKYGFKEELTDRCVDFSAWDTYKVNNVDSNIQFMNRRYINPIDNKRTFYNIINKYNLVEHIPKTFPYISQLNDELLDKSKIYFLKYIHGSGGKDVYPVKCMSDINNIVKDPIDNYLLQEEVPNMYLHNGCKTTMRNYVILCEYGVYLYKEGYVYLYTKKYNRNSLDIEIHNTGSVCQYNGTNCIYEKLSIQPYYHKIFPQLCHICSSILNNYLKEIPCYNQYILLGIDFIIDNDYKPYIIEINGFPCLSKSGVVEVKYNMLNDFITMYVLPKVSGSKQILGGWVKI
tara:strand:+ start:338 stop:1348 length:1011 start_codon:yes stop_codon:yes gene_type:complete